MNENELRQKRDVAILAALRDLGRVSLLDLRLRAEHYFGSPISDDDFAATMDVYRKVRVIKRTKIDGNYYYSIGL